MTCARRGVSLEQRTHRPVMFQSCFVLLGTSFATVEDAAYRTDARNCAQRHRPVAFAAEGLRLVLCFAFNYGIRVDLTLSRVLTGQRLPNPQRKECSYTQEPAPANRLFGLCSWLVLARLGYAGSLSESLTIGYSSFSGHYVPLWIAIEDELGKKYGLDLKAVYAGRARP